MAQDNHPDNDLEDDLDMDLAEDWDDLDQDEFEDGFSSDDEDVISSDDAQESDAPSEDTPVKKSKKKDKAPKEKNAKKKSGGGLIMGVMALATLGSVSWLAFGNNPQVLSLLAGDQEQQYLPISPAQNQNDIPVSDDAPALDLDGQQVEAPQAEQANTADMHENVAEDFVLAPTPSGEEARPDYQDEVLTPMPDLDTLSQNQGLDLASLRDGPSQDNTPSGITPPAPVLDGTQETSISIDGLPAIDAIENENTAMPVLPEQEPIALEEKKLLEETEKTFDSVAVPPAADPLDIPLEAPAAASIDETQIEMPSPVAPMPSLSAEKKPEQSFELPAAEEKPEIMPITAPEPVKQDDVPTPAPEKKAEMAQQAEKQKESPSPKAEATKAEVTPAQVSPPKPVKLPVWELRSAGAGSAVIYDKTTGNVLSIGIGSNVTGVGRVKSIERVNGKWQVTGTSGTIKQ